jgi:hypothetical protein
MITRVLLASTLAAASILAAGCGKNRLHKVEGVVTLNGNPLAGATVQFVPDDGGRPANGLTGDDGSFKLTTYNTGDGARAGGYKVTVTVSASPSEIGAPSPNDPEGLKKAMAEYAKKQQEEKKKPTKKKPPTVHPNYSKVDKTPLRQQVPADGKVELQLNDKGS